MASALTIRSNLIKFYLLPILINERDIHLIAIKKANQFISLKFGEFQFLVLMNFLVERRILIRTWKLTNPQRPKVFSVTNSLMTSKNRRIQKFLRMIFSQVKCAGSTAPRSINRVRESLEKWNDTDQARTLFNLTKSPPLWIENYQYLQKEQMSTFGNFLRWYLDKDLAPTLEAMHKRIASPRERHRHVEALLLISKPG